MAAICSSSTRAGVTAGRELRPILRWATGFADRWPAFASMLNICSSFSKMEAVDGVLKVVSDRVEADGKTTHFEWTAKFDGKDYPVKGDPGRDAVSMKKVDDYTLDITNKKASKVTTTIHAVYAHDGKSRTETTTGTDAQGKKVENVTEWTKQ